MVELREILELKRKCREEGRLEPALFPLFFEFTVEECENAGWLLERYGEVFEKEGFFEASRQRICSTEEMIAAIGEVATYPGLVKGKGETDRMFVEQIVRKVSDSYRRGLINLRSKALG